MKKLIVSLTAILIVSAVCLTSCRKDGGATYTTKAPEATTKVPETTKVSETTTRLNEDMTEAVTDLWVLPPEVCTKAEDTSRALFPVSLRMKTLSMPFLIVI